MKWFVYKSETIKLENVMKRDERRTKMKTETQLSTVKITAGNRWIIS